MQSEPGRRAIVVLGMHRSGTSALTRVLNLLGAALPSDLVAPAEDNPLGFWESARAIALNEAFMGEVGITPDNTDIIPDVAFRSDVATAYARRIAAYLDEEFADTSLFALKDPRIARLAPLWVAALREFRAELGFVLPFRAPAEVARSLMKREAMSRDHATLLWLRYVLDAERASRNFPRAFIAYDTLVSDWRVETDKIARRLDLAWPRQTHAAAVEIDGFLHAGRSARDGRRADGDALLALAEEVFALHRNAADAGVIDSERLDEIAAELGRAEAAYAPRLARATNALDAERKKSSRLAGRVAQLEAELAQAASRAADAGRLVAVVDEQAGELDRARRALSEAQAQAAELQRAFDSLSASSEQALESAAAELQDRAVAQEALRTVLAERERATAAQGERHAHALAAAIHGERALGERLLEVLAETRRLEARSDAAEQRLQGLQDDLNRARHEATAFADEGRKALEAARAAEARAQAEVLRQADDLARARAAAAQLTARVSASEEAARAQAARADLILASRSWALTRPVRGLRRAAGRLLRGV